MPIEAWEQGRSCTGRVLSFLCKECEGAQKRENAERVLRELSASASTREQHDQTNACMAIDKAHINKRIPGTEYTETNTLEQGDFVYCILSSFTDPVQSASAYRTHRTHT